MATQSDHHHPDEASVDGQRWELHFNDPHLEWWSPSSLKDPFHRAHGQKIWWTFKEGKTAISTNNRKFALTTDVWTNVATKAGLRVTCHCITNDWDMQSPLCHSRTDILHWNPGQFHQPRAWRWYLCSMRHWSIQAPKKSSEDATCLVEHLKNSELAKLREKQGQSKY